MLIPAVFVGVTQPSQQLPSSPLGACIQPSVATVLTLPHDTLRSTYRSHHYSPRARPDLRQWTYHHQVLCTSLLASRTWWPGWPYYENSSVYPSEVYCGPQAFPGLPDVACPFLWFCGPLHKLPLWVQLVSPWFHVAIPVFPSKTQHCSHLQGIEPGFYVQKIHRVKFLLCSLRMRHWTLWEEELYFSDLSHIRQREDSCVDLVNGWSLRNKNGLDVKKPHTHVLRAICSRSCLMILPFPGRPDTIFREHSWVSSHILFL